MSNKPANSLGAHLKKQNFWFYLSAISSVAIIALMFIPWITEPKSASLLTLLLDSSKSKNATELFIFMIPIIVGIIFVHGLYLFSIMRPDNDPIFLGTVTVLLGGLMLFMFLFATDIAYSLITVKDNVYTSKFLEFLGADHWTWTPVIWFVITLLQSLLFAKLAHKKPVISYT